MDLSKFMVINSIIFDKFNTYFWHTYSDQEIDLVEEYEGRLFGCKLKWSENKPIYPPQAWLDSYPDAEFTVINTGNYLAYLLAE